MMSPDGKYRVLKYTAHSIFVKDRDYWAILMENKNLAIANRSRQLRTQYAEGICIGLNITP